MPGTKKMPDLELILKVVMPSDPTFHFKNYVYIRLIVTKLGILKGVTSHSHTITNIHCKCSFNMYLSCPLLHRFASFNMQNNTKKMIHHRGTCNMEGHKEGGVRKGAGRKKRMQSVDLKTWAAFQWIKSSKLAKTHEQFGSTHIPDVLQIKCNFNGQLHDPRTTEE